MNLWEVLSGKDITQHPVHKMNRVSSAYRALFHLYHLAKQEEGLKGNAVSIKVLHYNKTYEEPANKSNMAHLVWSCNRIDLKERPDIDTVLNRYQQ